MRAEPFRGMPQGLTKRIQQLDRYFIRREFLLMLALKNAKVITVAGTTYEKERSSLMRAR